MCAYVSVCSIGSRYLYNNNLYINSDKSGVGWTLIKVDKCKSGVPTASMYFMPTNS